MHVISLCFCKTQIMTLQEEYFSVMDKTQSRRQKANFILSTMLVLENGKSFARKDKKPGIRIINRYID